MDYHGKLYGKIGNKYFDTSYTSNDWDRKDAEISALKEQIEVLERAGRIEGNSFEERCSEASHYDWLDDENKRLEELLKAAESDLEGSVQLLNNLFTWAKVKDSKATFSTSEETWNVYKKFKAQVEATYHLLKEKR